MRKTYVLLIILFTAAQAAQKFSSWVLRSINPFTAAQAAQR